MLSELGRRLCTWSHASQEPRRFPIKLRPLGGRAPSFMVGLSVALFTARASVTAVGVGESRGRSGESSADVDRRICVLVPCQGESEEDHCWRE